MSENWCITLTILTLLCIQALVMRLVWILSRLDELIIPSFLSRFIRACLEEIRNPTPLHPPQDRDFIRFGPKLPAADRDLYDQEATAKDD